MSLTRENVIFDDVAGRPSTGVPSSNGTAAQWQSAATAEPSDKQPSAEMAARSLVQMAQTAGGGSCGSRPAGTTQAGGGVQMHEWKQCSTVSSTRVPTRDERRMQCCIEARYRLAERPLYITVLGQLRAQRARSHSCRTEELCHTSYTLTKAVTKVVEPRRNTCAWCAAGADAVRGTGRGPDRCSRACSVRIKDGDLHKSCPVEREARDAPNVVLVAGRKQSGLVFDLQAQTCYPNTMCCSGGGLLPPQISAPATLPYSCQYGVPIRVVTPRDWPIVVRRARVQIPRSREGWRSSLSQW